MMKLLTPRRTLFSLVFLAALGWLALRSLPDGLGVARLHVWFLNVGQGDAILIQTPDGRQVLVDGGPSPSALFDQLGEVLPFWDRSLDIVVLTHPDADHVSGLIPLLDRYKVATVVDSLAADDKAADMWRTTITAAHVSHQTAQRGMRLITGSAVFTVLNPPGPDTLLSGNDHSIVLRLDYGQASLLLTGDAEQAAEDSMLASDLPLVAGVLKVGHHGSAASTSPAFLAAVQPRLAVISVGAENRFGHPAPELLQRLHGIEVLRTDERGRIELVSDGKGWTVHTER